MTVLLNLMPDANVCINAGSNFWQFKVGASEVEVLLYSKHDVQGLIHDLDTFIYFRSCMADLEL